MTALLILIIDLLNLVIIIIMAAQRVSLLLPRGWFGRRGLGFVNINPCWIEVGRIMQSGLGQRGRRRLCELPGPAELDLMASGEELAQRLRS